jgi:hypothetical protein
VRINGTLMQSATPGTSHTVSIFTHTAVGCASGADFIKQVADRAAASTSPAAAWESHTTWWEQFWNRSWIMLDAPLNSTNFDTSTSTSTSNGNDADSNTESNTNADADAKIDGSNGDTAAMPEGTLPVDAAAVTEAYYLNRYLVAIQSRGMLPMHHNGGTVTWGWDGKSHANPDQRNWGGGYWFQNVRHSYWYALAAGDFDLMEPLYKMCVAHTSRCCGIAGSTARAASSEIRGEL